MKQSKLICSLIVIASFLTGCVIPPTQIISEPSGAHIEVNNNYIGTTPCSVMLPNDGLGSIQGRTTVTALPNKGGQYTQTKFLHGGDKVPETMFFKMTLRPIRNDINLNVQ